MMNDSAIPISRPPSIAPGSEPIPPTTAAVKALSPARKPIVFVTWLNSSPAITPATPASAEPRKNVAAIVRFTLMPIISAASRSAATARMPICLSCAVRLFIGWIVVAGELIIGLQVVRLYMDGFELGMTTEVDCCGH